jgi:hypothetical protein
VSVEEIATVSEDRTASIKRLREQTGAPISACKEALEYSEGNIDAARLLLQATPNTTGEDVVPPVSEVSRKWEYKLCALHYGVGCYATSYAQWEQELHHLGAGGWEAVGPVRVYEVQYRNDSHAAISEMLLFKRIAT